jgi:hypothetical protein
MNASIRKEVRSLAPVFAITVVATTVASILLIGHDATAIVAMIFSLGCMLMGGCAIGNEFQLRTMAVLLAQPRRRQRVWGEKMAVLAGSLALAMGISVLSIRLFIKGEGQPKEFLDLVGGLAVLAAVVFCSTPYFTLATKNTIAGMGMTIVVPAVGSLLILAGDWVLSKISPPTELRLATVFERGPNRYIIGLGLIYGAICSWLGSRKFLRLQLIEGQGQEVALPARVEDFLGKLLKSFVPQYSGPTRSLIRKELQLQRTSFIITAVACLLLACEAIVWSSSKAGESTVATTLLVSTFSIYCVLIPFVTGSVCVADERNWGVAMWQNTLPASVTKQAVIKLLVTYFTGFLLGVAIPGLLLFAGKDWFGMKIDFLDHTKGPEWLVLGHVYLVIFSLIVLASSISRNAGRAIAAGLGLIVAIGTTMGVLMEKKILAPMPVYHGIWWPFLRIMWGVLLVAVVVTYLNIQKADFSFRDLLQQLRGFVNPRKQPLVFASILAACLGIAGWEIFRVREPAYKGRSLSEWLQEYDRPFLDFGIPLGNDPEADPALRHFGARALPYLAEMAESKRDYIRIRAYCGFEALGKAATPVIPLLAKSVNEPYPIGELAIGAIARTGLDGLETLTNALSHGDSRTRANIALVLGYYGNLGSEKQPYHFSDLSSEESAVARQLIVPILLTFTSDSDPQVANHAIWSLSMIREQPEVVIPRLIELLKSPLERTRLYALNALHRYGSKARNAVPGVVKLLDDSDRQIRNDAKSALKTIDPETAAKMGIK